MLHRIRLGRFLSAMAAVAAFLLVAQSANAASAQLSTLNPVSGQRGTEVEVKLNGRNLSDAEEVLFDDTGLEVLELTVPENGNGRQVRIKLKIAEDCRLGAHRLRVRTRTGLSDLRLFHVGALPHVEEEEPNTEFDAAQKIEKGVTVLGGIDEEDVDYFAVDAKAGERLTVEVMGMRLGMSRGGRDFFDPYLAILDENRFEIVSCDDHALLWNDGFVSLKVPEDGRYVIAIRDTAYNGDNSCSYCLHVGDFPRPAGTIPSGGKPGETLDVTFLGDVNGPITRTVTLPDEIPEDPYGLHVEDEKGISPSWNWFRVSHLDNAIEQEPNDSMNDATASPAPGAMNGVLAAPGDEDWFKFEAKKGAEYEVTVYGRQLRSAIDAVINVYQVEGRKSVEGNDDRIGLDGQVKFKAPADGEYAVRIRDHLSLGGPDYTYRIEVAPAQKAVRAQPIEFDRYVQPPIIIPRGAARGIVANIRREGFGGPVDFVGVSLPEGVRIECPESWQNDGSASVIFFAEEDAPLAGGFYDVDVVHKNEKAGEQIAGPLYEDALMIRGRNNNRVWEEKCLRLPIVVAEEAPFRVWIEEPQAPLVQGGVTELTVKCERSEGFEGDIRILMLQNPPGCNSSRSVRFKKDQTEVKLPINASANAATRESMVAVRAMAEHADGTVEICSDFVPLRVEERYVDFEYQTAAVEQGQETKLLVKVTQNRDFEGEAKVQLSGLPSKVTAEPLTLTSDTKELVFTVKADEKSPDGTHKTVFAQVLVPHGDQTVTHNLGGGRLRIDKPQPAEEGAEKQEKTPKVASEKPLSRLEQLRLAQKNRNQE